MTEKRNLRKFKINDYLSLQLNEDGNTIIFVARKPFRHCKYLLINIPVEEISNFDEIESIDEAAEKLDKSLEPLRERKEFKYNIPSDTEFWGHCSNLQVWYENEYNTRLLHANLAFPLLRELSRAGDLQAKKIFKEEIVERYNNGVESVREYLRSMKYLDYLSIEEFLGLIENDNDREVIEQLRESHPQFERREIGGMVLILNIDIKKGRVSEIHLGGLELKHVPECIRDLTLLENLNVQCNSLEVIPEWIGEFNVLKTLKIEDNIIKKLPKEIGKLQNLVEVYARGNQIEYPPESIGNLKSLRILELYQNQLERVPETIGNLSSLELLDLHENQLVSLPETIGNLTNLKRLILNKNKLTDLPDSIINLKALRRLDLRSNDLDKLTPPIGKLNDLEVISIAGNPIFKLPESLYFSEKLRELYIDNTYIRKDLIFVDDFRSKTLTIYD